MEQIDNLTQQNKQLLQQHQPSQGFLKKTNKNNHLIDFCKQFSPDYQFKICNDADSCYFGNYPTLAKLQTEYGKNAAMAFIIPHLQDLATYCGCSAKLDEKQYTECAFVISAEFYYLKITELMLFCHRFKSGRYGRFYGSVDPMVITTSLRDFLKERATAYRNHINEEEERREMEHRKKHPPMCYPEWVEIKTIIAMYNSDYTV